MKAHSHVSRGGQEVQAADRPAFPYHLRGWPRHRHPMGEAQLRASVRRMVRQAAAGGPCRKDHRGQLFLRPAIKGRLPSSAIHYSDYPRTRGKAEVLSNALDLEGNVDVMVDSDKAEVVYYLGGEAWCLGLIRLERNRMRSGLCNGNVFYPKSIRRQSVYKRMRTDSIPPSRFSGGTGQPPESLPTYARSLGSDRIRGARGVGHERPIRHPPSRPSASDNRSSLTLTYKRRTVMA